MACLQRVPGIHRLDGNPLLVCHIANLRVELCKPLPVQPLIYVFAVVYVLADVRQIFQHQQRVLDGLGVLNDLAGHTVGYVADSVPQRVTVGLGQSLTATLLKPPLGGEIGFAGLTNLVAIVGPQFGATRSWGPACSSRSDNYSELSS